MTNRTDTKTATAAAKAAALASFTLNKARIDLMLARLTALSADHFNLDPETVNWGDAGTLAAYADKLKQITDSAFKEGEHAA